LLGAKFIDGVQRAAAARAFAALDVDHHLVAGQVRGQRTEITVGPDIAPLPTLVLGRVRRVLGGLVLGDALLDVLQPELELIRIELLGAAAKLVPRQALDQQPQLVVLGG